MAPKATEGRAQIGSLLAFLAGAGMVGAATTAVGYADLTSSIRPEVVALVATVTSAAVATKDTGPVGAILRSIGDAASSSWRHTSKFCHDNDVGGKTRAAFDVAYDGLRLPGQGQQLSFPSPQARDPSPPTPLAPPFPQQMPSPMMPSSPLPVQSTSTSVSQASSAAQISPPDTLTDSSRPPDPKLIDIWSFFQQRGLQVLRMSVLRDRPGP